ncbi:hypothetical protein FGG08_007076 [Glutinoglossum americanum]|uniref:Proteasome maturation factor UMP1 n=1 Tax=Glutinoglossum americanum TaxID=1670608 RepID=A0A9P8L1B2_9PEZI|nr:hypothetical protein FGG08_007076 [Glutinoglossum americanum]
MSLTIIPSTSTTHPRTTPTPPKTAPSAPGLHDTLRSGLPSLSSTINTSHPLEARLKHWTETQEAAKMESLRRLYGLAEPVRRGMEMRIVREGEGLGALGGVRVGGAGSSVHEDILRGRDQGCTWEEVFKGDELADVDFHTEMEARLKMNW